MELKRIILFRRKEGAELDCRGQEMVRMEYQREGQALKCSLLHWSVSELCW